MHFIYIENEIRDHPRTQAICRRFPKATLIYCEHYGEIFNRKGQNFRLQKNQPALILAKKHKKHVLAAPEGYGIGGENNYYFSHMLNCVYDCRYCFLQGMYRSAYYVIFINYEEFFDAIKTTMDQYPNKTAWFFSGYDCDSLAYEPVTQFVDNFIPFFRTLPNAYVELRTKSTQIRALLQQQPIDNCVIAFSFTPQNYSQNMEHGVPTLQKRIDAMEKLQNQGWKLGVRFDPVIYQPQYQADYDELFTMIFSRLDPSSIHSVSLGAFRIPKIFHQNIVNLYPDDKLYAVHMEEHNGLMYYAKEHEKSMLDFCRERLMQHIPDSIFFSCTPPE